MLKRDLSYELIIVDDNSRDGTEDIVVGLSNKGYSIKLFTHYRDKDLSTAVIYGFDNACGDILVCMDADRP